MADQVNPLGGLAPGMAQTFQTIAAPPQPKSTPAGPVESKPKAEEGRDVGVSKASLEEGTKKSLEEATKKKKVEDILNVSPSELKFVVDKETGITYFKIVDPVTQETIRQVPAEEILEMSKRLRALSDSNDASGLLMDAEG